MTCSYTVFFRLRNINCFLCNPQIIKIAQPLKCTGVLFVSESENTLINCLLISHLQAIQSPLFDDSCVPEHGDTLNKLRRIYYVSLTLIFEDDPKYGLGLGQPGAKPRNTHGSTDVRSAIQSFFALNYNTELCRTKPLKVH